VRYMVLWPGACSLRSSLSPPNRFAILSGTQRCVLHDGRRDDWCDSFTDRVARLFSCSKPVAGCPFAGETQGSL